MDEGCRWAPGSLGFGFAIQADIEELRGWVPLVAVADLRGAGAHLRTLSMEPAFRNRIDDPHGYQQFSCERALLPAKLEHATLRVLR